MRIAILSFYSGMNQRGVERWVYELGKRLSDKHRLTVYQNLQLKEKPPYNVICTNLSFNRKNISYNRILRRLFIDYSSLKVLQFNLKILISIFKGNYDLIIPTDGGWEPAIIRIITWIRRKKMIIVGHSGIGWDDMNNLWSFPDCFVALSSYSLNWAKKVNTFVKAVYIPNGVDVKTFCPVGRKLKMDFDNDYKTAICVSALEKSKRIDLIIKAVSQVEKLNLLVCGEGELEEELKLQGRKILGLRFKLKSYKFDNMPALYRTSDIFLSASTPAYSFEMVILEAMASGLTVVVNDDPIRREIVGNAGYVTNVSDPKEFSKTIIHALTSQKRKDAIENAKRYSWDVIADRYLDLFKDIQLV